MFKQDLRNLVLYNHIMEYFRCFKWNTFKLIFAFSATFFTYLYITYVQVIDKANLGNNDSFLLINLFKSYFVELNINLPTKFLILFSFWFAFSTTVYSGIWILQLIITKVENFIIIKSKYTNLK